MSQVLLVRHAACEGMGVRLNGWLPGIRLTAQGRVEAERLALKLSAIGDAVILSSPRERCLETADILASQIKAPVETLADLDEVDFGEWSGMSFDQLSADPAWSRWNAERATARPPGGENMADVQARMNRALALAATRTAQRTVILTSHAEPIRAALANVLGFSLDRWSRLEISPASVTTFDASASCVRSVNQNSN